MIDHVVLLLLMGVAGAGIVVLVVAPLRRGVALVAGTAWYLGCLVPLVLVPSGRLPEPLALADSVDYAGAAGLHVSMFVFVAVSRRIRGPRLGMAAREQGRASLPPATAAGVGAVLIMAWGSWLVALEGEIGPFTANMVVNCVAAAFSGAGAGLATGLVRRRGLAGASLEGTVAGLAVSSAAAASLPVGGAVATAMIAAVVVGSTHRWQRRTVLESLVVAAGTGALVGLLSVGLLDERAGFFYAGQPTLALAQVALVILAVALPLAVGIAVGVTMRLAEKTWEGHRT